MSNLNQVTLSNLAENIMPLVRAQYLGRMTYQKIRSLQTLVDQFFTLEHCPETKAQLEPLRESKKITAALLLQAVLTAREEMKRAQGKAPEIRNTVSSVIGSQPDLVDFCTEQARKVSTIDVDNPLNRALLVASALLSDKQLKEAHTKCTLGSQTKVPDYDAELAIEEARLKKLEESKPWSYGIKGIARRIRNSLDTGYFFKSLLLDDPFSDIQQKINLQQSVVKHAQEKVAKKAELAAAIEKQNQANDSASKIFGQLFANRMHKKAQTEAKRRLPPDSARPIDQPTALALVRLESDMPEVKLAFDEIVTGKKQLSPADMFKYLRNIKQLASSSEHASILNQMQLWIVQSIDQGLLDTYAQAMATEKQALQDSIQAHKNDLKSFETRSTIGYAISEIIRGNRRSAEQRTYERRAILETSNYIKVLENGPATVEMNAIADLFTTEVQRRASTGTPYIFHPANNAAPRKSRTARKISHHPSVLQRIFATACKVI
ncbi:MAG: hypothetical protein EYC62_02315 [Alphaproteobacteria bacterium]|nr:MAG: hypothetical protein EYC62_02315 [Alphaproteobacteria bacterium]